MTETPDRNLGSAWYLVGILMLAQTCSFIDRMIMGLMVGPIRQSFGISDTQFSLLAGLAFSLFYSLMGLMPMGLDRLLVASPMVVKFSTTVLLTSICDSRVWTRLSRLRASLFPTSLWPIMLLATLSPRGSSAASRTPQTMTRFGCPV